MNQLVLLDASFWIALRDSREPWHGRARNMARQLLAVRNGFVFTTPILAEVHAYFSRSQVMRTQVLDDAQNNPVLRWEPVTPQDEAEAIRLLRLHQDKCYSLCDAISFAIMRRLGLKRAASFDAHFRQFGEFEIIA